MKHAFKQSVSERLNLKCDELLSSFIFSFKLWRYKVGALSSVPGSVVTGTDTFSYNIPVIISTTPVPTEGSAASGVPATIQGYNFGPVGDVSKVRRCKLNR